MQKIPVKTVFDVITDFLTSDPTPQEIIDYRMPDDLQKRLDELLVRNGEGQLTFDEQRELFDYIRANEMMSLLILKTKLKLQDNNQ